MCVCLYTKIRVHTQHKVETVWGPLIVALLASLSN